MEAGVVTSKLNAHERVVSALGLSFLAQVSPNVVARLAMHSVMHHIPAGRIFVEPGESQRCGVIFSGLARVYSVGLDGRHVTFRRVGPGGAVGIRALIGRRSGVTVQAVTEIEFCELDGRSLRQLGLQDPTVAMAIAQEIDRRLEDTELHIENALGGGVLQRTAGALLDLSPDGEPLYVHASQAALAEIVGASRDWVGRALRILEERRLIQRSRAVTWITDPMQLQAVARGPSATTPREPL